MTASIAPDAERVLDAYADATRIVASAQLVRRFQACVADERARSAGRPWSGAVARLDGARLRLSEPFSVAFARHVTFALRLQSLALVLLTVLALGALVGGAGAVIVSVVNAPDRGANLPGRIWAPGPSDPPSLRSPSVPARVAPSPSSAPVATVKVLAQKAPRTGERRGHDRQRRHAERPLDAGPPGCPMPGTWSRDRHCAS